MRLGDPGLERVYRGGASRVVDPGDGEHVGEILLVGLARLDEALFIEQVVVAVGHAEPGLRQPHHVGVGILLIDVDHRAHRAGGTRLRGRHEGGHVREALQRGDPLEVTLHRGEPRALDRGGVLEGVVEVEQLALLGAQGGGRLFCEGGDDRAQLLLIPLVQFQVDAGRDAVGRDRRGL